MIDRNDPPRGSMYLYDDISPPTLDGSYKMTITTRIDYGETQSAPIDRYFDVVGPRFALDPTVVANVYPPRNGQGAYHEALPQIVLKRRTLPWERRIDSDDHPLPLPQDQQNLPQGQVPWVALLLFEEGEYTLLDNQKLEDVVPAEVFTRLGSPQNILCDAVESDAQLVQGILPSREELQLLSHVRQVNVEDRELNAGSSDGFFSVVISNRLPAPGSKCRACLVSLEQRTDLVSADPLPFEYPGGLRLGDGGIIDGGVIVAPAPPAAADLEVRPVEPLEGKFIEVRRPFPRPPVRLVLLHTWQFTSQGPGTFRTIMMQLDSGMIGLVKEPGKPALTDTGHMRFQVLDRAGAQEIAWYRGPLVPWQLTRDTLGPYHSADQCRRATPETGAEDVSYAAAFEVGRQLAAADARLALELMRWRRESYRQAARVNTMARIQTAIPVDFPGTIAEALQSPVAPLVSVSAAKVLVDGAPAVGDRYGINVAAKTLGMDAKILSETWKLASPAEAAGILGGDPGTLGASVAPSSQSPRANVTLEQVAADAAGLNHLREARTRLLDTASTRIESLKGGSR